MTKLKEAYSSVWPAGIQNCLWKNVYSYGNHRSTGRIAISATCKFRAVSMGRLTAATETEKQTKKKTLDTSDFQVNHGCMVLRSAG